MMYCVRQTGPLRDVPAQSLLFYNLFMKSSRKYWAIFQITMLNSLAYPGELVGRSLMIVPFMWVFYQLWKVTYAASGSEVISPVLRRIARSAR